MSDGVRLRRRVGPGWAGPVGLSGPILKQSETKGSAASGFKPEMRAGLLASVY